MFRPGEVYATLYNSNYVPQYFGFCLFIGMYFLIFELTPVYVDERVCLCVEVDGRELVFLNTGDERWGRSR